MKSSSNWRWCVAGNIREHIPRRPDSLWPASLPPLKKVFIGKDYDPASGEVTVAGMNIRRRSVVIVRAPLRILTNIRVMKTCNAWSLQMMHDQEADGLWWGSSLADMKDAEEYRDLLRTENGPQKTAPWKTEY